MCMWCKDCWSSYVEPSNALGHFGGNASREHCYLPMDVHKKGVRGPVSLFVDAIMWDAIEVHGHGSTGTKRMAANSRGWKTFFVKTGGNDSSFEHVVDHQSMHLCHFVRKSEFFSYIYVFFS